jgi:uncharacterized membrane protein
MSRFLSPKFLKYRQAAEHGPIDHDLPCPRCGYNLRGLNYGRNCPECGSPIELTHTASDALLSGDEAQRAQWKTGLGLGVISLSVILAARLLCFVASTALTGPELARAYLIAAAAGWTGWALAAWLLTPPALDDTWPKLRRMRLAGRWLALLWLPAYACLIVWLALPGAGRGHALFLLSVAGRAAAGVGMLLLVYLLLRIAEAAELEGPVRRLNLALWFLPIATVFVLVIPVQIAWSSLILFGPLAFLFIVILLFWVWALLMVLWSLYSMYQHVRWTQIHAGQAVGRPMRIERKRREFDKETEATIRPVPESKGEVTLEEERKSPPPTKR